MSVLYQGALALIERSATCVIGSIDSHGDPAMCAMLQPRERDGMKQLIFSTNTTSQHVREYRDNSAASVYFYDPQLFQGLLLRGKMTIADDQLMRNRIWRDGDEMYYKLGPTDPDCCAMLFTAHGGRWYENLETHDLKI